MSRPADETLVRTCFYIGVCLVATALPVRSESNPSWWGLAPIDATAIVGIQWQNLRSSPFADAIWSELDSEIGLPPLPCLAGARQILIASPSLLAIISGSFNAVTLRAEASKIGMKPAGYQGVNLWIAKSGLSLAQLSDQLILAGSRKALDAAIDRSQAERHHYSPLVARGARYGQTDLWVVTDHLPDPLASIFVPIDVDTGMRTGGFEGYVTLGDGLTVEGALDAVSEENAAAVAEKVRESIPSLPAVAQGLDVRVDTTNVLLSLQVGQAEFDSELRGFPARAAQPVTTPRPVSAPVPPAPPVPSVAPIPPVAPIPSGPQVIRIFGLEDGPKEIVLPPPPKPDKP
jgi:hypothetical protein